MLFHHDTQELSGVHTIGTGVTEVLHIGQVVPGMEAGFRIFFTTVFNDPTLTECYKMAASDVFNKLKQSQ